MLLGFDPEFEVRAKSLYFPLQVHPFFFGASSKHAFFFGYGKDAPFLILSSTTFGYSSPIVSILGLAGGALDLAQ